MGDAKAYASLEDMVSDPAIDALWICGPNHARVENLEAVVAARRRGADLVGIACEKPLARNVAEAKRVLELVEEAGVLHAYLEDQLFSPGLERGHALAWGRGAALSGRPYLARAAEEHAGPHAPWFWRGELGGGGVLTDMMCHSLEVGRFLLTKPGGARHSIRPVKVSAQIASLKWSRPEYAALDLRAGVEVVELLMACYMSAEEERVVTWRPEGLDTFVPAVARGDWRPQLSATRGRSGSSGSPQEAMADDRASTRSTLAS